MKEVEIWKEIERYDGAYMISNLGRIKSMSRLSKQNHKLPEKILSPSHNNSGYCDISLQYEGKRYHEKIHRLVAKAFVPNPRHLNEVDHIDGNKDNNRWENLRWCTHSENHLNPILVKRMREKNRGKKWTASMRLKLQTKVGVYKDDVLLHVFESYKDLDSNSKEIIGTQLWNVYVRQVIKGTRKAYKGFTFKEL